MTQDEYRKGPTLPCGHSDAFAYHHPAIKPHHRCLKCDKHADYVHLVHIHFYECCNVGAWDCPACGNAHHCMDNTHIKDCERCGSQFTRKSSGLYSVTDRVTRVELLLEET